MADNQIGSDGTGTSPDMLGHQSDISKISDQVKKFYDTGKSFRIYHGSTNSTRPSASKSRNFVDTSALDKIIRVDLKNLIAIVQPNVTMDALVLETLKYSLIPLVVTEFPGITVGGAFSGTAGESSSFKHGFFDESVTQAEVVLANGEVVTCSPDSRPDLFKGLPGSLGTLGVVTLLYIQLQRAYKYVEVAYHPFRDAKDAISLIQRLNSTVGEGSDSIDFMDGIMFSATKGAIVTGRMVDVNPQRLPIQRLVRPRDPYYSMHVGECLDRDPSKPVRELIPLPDYVFRYNRGIFWLGQQTFEITGIKCTPFARKLTHHHFTARMGYARLHAQAINVVLIQDLAIPFAAAEEFIKWLGERYSIYPLWLCPLRIPAGPTLHPHHWRENTSQSSMMLNIGLYDVHPRTYEDWVEQNRDLESKVHEVGGMKWSYASQTYDEDTFWSQHDREWYNGLRQKYNATTLPNIYKKTIVNVEEGMKIWDRSRPDSWIRRMLQNPVTYGKVLIGSFRAGAWKQEKSKAWYSWPDPD